MTFQLMTVVSTFNEILGSIEWYEDTTISVDTLGNIDTITSVQTSSFNTTTIIVKPNGDMDTTTEI